MFIWTIFDHLKHDACWMHHFLLFLALKLTNLFPKAFQIWKKMFYLQLSPCEKCPNKSFSGPYFPVFVPEQTPYLDTFYTVIAYNSLPPVCSCIILTLFQKYQYSCFLEVSFWNNITPNVEESGYIEILQFLVLDKTFKVF